MNPGLRIHKQATANIVEANAFPEHLRDHLREVFDLKSGNQRKGHGTALMYQICTEADRERTTLILKVDQEEGKEPTNEQLKKWYSSFGFEIGQESPCLMIRLPQAPLIVTH